MRRFILLQIFILVCLIQINAQSWSYSNTITGDNNIDVLKSSIDSDGSVIVMGFFLGSIQTASGEELFSYGGRDYFIVKFDQSGNVDWIRQLGSTLNEFVAGSITTDKDGNVYATGSFQNDLKYTSTDSISSIGGFDIFLIKYDNDGGVVWCKNIGSGIKHQRSTAVTVDDQGDVIVTGYFSDSIYFNESNILYSSNSSADIFYGKFNSIDGDLKWVKHGKAIDDIYSATLTDVISGNDYCYLTGIFRDSIAFDNDTIVSDVLGDISLIKLSSEGEIIWIRSIRGDDIEKTYSLSTDSLNNVIVAGYYTSLSLSIDSTESIKNIVEGNNGGTDILISKYSPDGVLSWVQTAGGQYDDKIYSSTVHEEEIIVSGSFRDTMNWGGIELISSGPLDEDMFTGFLDINGNFRSSNSYGGRNNSSEDGASIFADDINIYSVIRSDSEVLVLGDSIYTSSNGKKYIAVGIIGCRPISIDQVITQDVQTCFGDSTGSIQILASGGFQAPWQYSIDNGLSYQNLAYFGELPAGEYPIVVIDSENCAQFGEVETLIQPQTLSLELVSEEFTGDSMVNIVVAAYGGTPPYTYTLQPNGIVQGFGDFSVKWSEPGYYFVEVNDIRNCGPVATDSLNVSSGIDLFAPGVKLYPNPTSGIITVEVPFQGSACTLEVLSLTGQVMLSRQVYSNGISINETIDLSDLSKGMYMIRVDGQTLKSGVVVN